MNFAHGPARIPFTSDRLHNLGHDHDLREIWLSGGQKQSLTEGCREDRSGKCSPLSIWTAPDLPRLQLLRKWSRHEQDYEQVLS